jgi:hypothetical protein
MMKLLIVAAILIVGCAEAQTKKNPPRVTVMAGGSVILTADTDPNATHCGGFINNVRIPDVLLQTTAPKCKVDATTRVQTGTNTWKACNSAPNKPEFSEGCNETLLTFTVAPPVTPLNPPTNMRMTQQ